MLKATILSAAIRASNAILGLGVAIVFSRTLGTQGYGMYSLAFGIACVWAILVQFGLPNLVMRETAIGNVDRDYARVALAWRWATRATMLFSLIALVLGLGTSALLWPRISASALWTSLLAFATVPFMALGAIRTGALRGLGYVVMGQIPESIVKPALLLVLGLTLGTLVPARSDIAMAMQLLAVIICFMIGSALLWAVRPSSLRAPQNQGHIFKRKAWALAALSMGLSAGMNQLNNYIDTFAIAVFLTISDVGIYRIAFSLSLLTLFGLQSISMFVDPSFAKLFRQKNLTEMRKNATVASQVSFYISLMLTLLFMFFGYYLIDVLFGAEYLGAYWPGIILMFSRVVSCYYGSTGQVLMMTGYESTFMKMRLFSLLINIVANILLVPVFSLIGAALATGASLVFLNIIANQKCKQAIGIDCAASFDLPRKLWAQASLMWSRRRLSRD